MKGPKLIAILAVGVVIVVICSVILAVYAGAPPTVDENDPTPVPTPKVVMHRGPVEAQISLRRGA